MKNNRGYTLVELLAIVTVLSIIVGMSSVAFNQVQNNVLEKDYENVISYIESTAVQYANDTGIIGAISVQDLIDSGYITPDDKENIYSPTNSNEILNCKKIEITYDNDQFSAEYQKEGLVETNETGKCTVQDHNHVMQLCTKEDGKCMVINESAWFNEEKEVYIIKGQDIIDYEKASLISWGNGEETATITVNQTGQYRVDVLFKGSNVESGHAEAQINIDRTLPTFSKIENNQVVYTDEGGSGINKICFFTDETVPTTCTDAMRLSSKSCATTSTGKRTITTTAKYSCAEDKAGNLSEKPTGVINTINLTRNDSAPETLRIEETEYYSSVLIEGVAQNNENGIQSYAFTTSSSTPSSWTSLGSTTKTEITQKYTVTSNGTYYFWVKYGDNTTAKKSIPINNVITPINTINLAIDTANSVVSSGSNYSSISIKGTAQNNYKGIQSYAFTTSSSAPSSWTSLGSTKRDEVVQSHTVTTNGVYYFWVKYGDGTTASKSIEITQILTEVNSITIAINTANSVAVPNNSGYYTSIQLKGTAHNNTKGIKAYTFNNSSSTPSSWTTLSSTTMDQIVKTTSATANKTYYFWVKYGDNTTAKKSITIDQLVSQYSTTLSLSDRDSSTQTGKKTISGIKLLGDVTVDNGSVSSKSLSGTTVTVKVTGGTKKTGSETETLTSSPTTSSATSSCSSYKCSSGGKVSGSKCVANNGSSYTLNTSPVQYATFTCSTYNKYQWNANSPSTSCATGYTKGSNVTYYKCSTSNCTPSNGTKLSCSPGCVYLNQSCTSNLSFYWIGSTTCTWGGDYNATCSKTTYSCSSGELVSSTCYKCSTGYTFNSSTKKCTKKVTTNYSYWEYVVTIKYYK